jgi:hypothetical protein
MTWVPARPCVYKLQPGSQKVAGWVAATPGDFITWGVVTDLIITESGVVVIVEIELEETNTTV